MSKTIFRVEKNKDNPFVMIDRRPIENPKLSWRAKGILTYLISRPDNWTVRLGDLVKRSTDGSAAIRKAVRELREAGHIIYNVERENGRIKQWILQVHEVPILHSDFLQVEKQQVENRTVNDIELTKKDLSNGLQPMPLDWKLAHGEEITQKDLETKDAERVDIANLIATGMGVDSTAAYNLAYAFMVARDITIPTSQVKGQRKAIKEMLELHVFPIHIVQAVQELTGKNMTITDLFSVSKTAIALANPAPTSGMNPQNLEIGT